MKIKECNIEEIMLEEYRNFSERSFRNTKGKNEFEEDKYRREVEQVDGR